MDHGLQEKPPWAAFRPPEIFENFMTLEEGLLVEKA